jgi:glyoxylase-like metal-dependent hydrolase (beta-lactamase superfamily II)
MPAQDAQDLQVVPPPVVHDLGNGVYVFEYLYCNSPFVVTDAGVLVMDTYNSFYARHLKQAIERLTDAPVSHVVYSHAHADHIRGAGTFRKTAKFIAQERQIPHLTYIKEDSFPMPDVVWGREHVITLGGKEILLRDYGINHGTGVTIMEIPESGLVTALDLAYVKRLGYYHLPDFNPRAWLRTLREMQRLDFAKAITGHGTPVANPQEFDEFANYLEDLLTQVHKVWKQVQHRGPFQGVEIARREVDLSKYKHWAFYDEFRDLNIMAAYHSIDMGF